jgi:hypothetical protein
MAAETGLSEWTIGRIWRAFGLKPHLVDMFRLSTDPQLTKVCDVVGLYLNRPSRLWFQRGREVRASKD